MKLCLAFLLFLSACATPVPTHDARALFFQVAVPSVRVIVKTGQSSGVVIAKRDGVAYVLTAAHVVGEETTCEVERFDGARYPATVDHVFKTEDLAVLRVVDSALYVGRIATRAELEGVRWGARVVAYGYPLGESEGVLTDGRITSVNNDGFLRYSAPTFYGNSGGGIWLRVVDGWAVISVAQRIANHPMTGPYPHVGRGVLPASLLDCLEGGGYVR